MKAADRTVGQRHVTFVSATDELGFPLVYLVTALIVLISYGERDACHDKFIWDRGTGDVEDLDDQFKDYDQ